VFSGPSTRTPFAGKTARRWRDPLLTGFWTAQLVLALGLNLIVQTIQIGAYAARLAGVQTGRIATSISLFNLFVLVSRLANLAYAPMLGTLSDRVAHAERLAHTAGQTAVATGAIAQFEWQVRLIVLAGTLGTAFGALLLPTFLMLFVRGISAFERLHSIPLALLRLLDPRVFIAILRSARLPSLSTLRRFSPGRLPKEMLIGNVIVTGVYAVGVVASVYASVLEPDVARTSVLLSGVVNGIATIAFTLIVDPTSAYITDQAVKGERPLIDVKAMVFYLSLTAIVGTLLSQLILYPGALLIGGVARLVNTLH
jgi:Amj-like protein